ncbi:MAG: asparagine synthase [Saprospiraceae bacterium]|nr:asparagine synthase [Saprospiraceae bacterium]
MGTDHTSYDCTYKDALELIPLLPKFYDDPIADISCIPTLLVSKVAKEHVKVALSADGGDELFGGYNGFKTFPEIISKVNKIKFKSSLGHFTKMVSPYFKNQRNHYGKKLKGLSELLLDQHDSQVYNLIKNSWGIPDEMCHKVMNFKSNVEHHKRNNWAYIDPMDELFVLGYEDVLTNLLLVKVDRASMGVSLESRSHCWIIQWLNFLQDCLLHINITDWKASGP